MSSSIDEIECPKCNRIATREQYTTGFVHTHCSYCGYEDEFDPEPKDEKEEEQTKRMEAYSEVWKCPNCVYKTKWSYRNLVFCGKPVCPDSDCDADLELTVE